MTLDIDAVAAIRKLADAANMSLARYVEAIMVTEAKTKGTLPHNYQLLGETRGKRWDLLEGEDGDRSQSKEEATDDEK